MFFSSRLKGLRYLALTKLSKAQLAPEDFAEFGIDVVHLQINFAHLKTVQNNAFRNIHNLKIIDLSENSIENIEKDAFTDVRRKNIFAKLV